MSWDGWIEGSASGHDSREFAAHVRRGMVEWPDGRALVLEALAADFRCMACGEAWSVRVWFVEHDGGGESDAQLGVQCLDAWGEGPCPGCGGMP